MSQPVRIQRKRTKGWKMPENTISVCRPGKFGNPFTVKDCWEAGQCVSAFRDWLGRDWWHSDESEYRRAAILKHLPELRGKNLACWCKVGEPCHADVLLELANHQATFQSSHECVSRVSNSDSRMNKQDDTRTTGESASTSDERMNKQDNHD